jgi:mono/diheme cytochrome c family protein
MRLPMFLLPLAAALSLGAAAAATAAQKVTTPPAFVAITLPAPHGEFKTAPGSDLATGRCLTCHSAEYVYMQPPLSKTAWTAEVKKMKNAYGAPIDDAEVAPLVDYLVGQNGKP